MKASILATLLVAASANLLQQQTMKSMIPALQDLHDMIAYDGPSAWFNGHEMYAANARQAESDAKDALKTGSSLLQSEMETDLEAERVEEQKRVEAEANAAVMQMKQASMSQLEYYLKNPQEHEAEVQRQMADGAVDQLEMDNFVKEALKNGFVKMSGGQKMPLMTTDPKEIKDIFNMLGSSFGDIGERMQNRMNLLTQHKSSLLETESLTKVGKSDLLRDAPSAFKRALKEWDVLTKEVVQILLNEPKGSVKEQDKQVAQLTHRAELAQQSLQKSSKGLSNSASLLEVAQDKITAQMAKEASSLVEAQQKTFPSLSPCMSKAEDGQSRNEVSESKCLCVTDKACTFAAGGHGMRAANFCNLLAQASCIPPYDPVV